MKAAVTLLGVFSILLAGCASDRVIIDRKGVSMAQYAQDRSECEAYADEVNTGEKVAEGTAAGAVLGGVFGAIFGDSGTAARGAGAGAVSGAAGGAGKAAAEKDRVVKNCLAGRGYKVLN
ncbi:glycine zipper family protein [Exilibacterium tricleocarpae]|uniref:Glycine zipper family protein n=1 Tax=Exilibacterium tricleocarpae TaxID=2591008 RepID=A0A545SSV3_9GAMM|nr:glycine zipper family protein [Exilibacterium tricleocarpae]TQV68050.1 glycine zipper family protein [Exilibacterium tricleocarpae]